MDGASSARAGDVANARMATATDPATIAMCERGTCMIDPVDASSRVPHSGLYGQRTWCSSIQGVQGAVVGTARIAAPEYLKRSSRRSRVRPKTLLDPRPVPMQTILWRGHACEARREMRNRSQSPPCATRSTAECRPRRHIRRRCLPATSPAWQAAEDQYPGTQSRLHCKPRGHRQ